MYHLTDPKHDFIVLLGYLLLLQGRRPCPLTPRGVRSVDFRGQSNIAYRTFYAGSYHHRRPETSWRGVGTDGRIVTVINRVSIYGFSPFWLCFMYLINRVYLLKGFQ